MQRSWKKQGLLAIPAQHWMGCSAFCNLASLQQMLLLGKARPLSNLYLFKYWVCNLLTTELATDWKKPHRNSSGKGKSGARWSWIWCHGWYFFTLLLSLQTTYTWVYIASSSAAFFPVFFIRLHNIKVSESCDKHYTLSTNHVGFYPLVLSWTSLNSLLVSDWINYNCYIDLKFFLSAIYQQYLFYLLLLLTEGRLWMNQN